MSLRSRITRRVWQRVLGHALVVIPLVIGATALTMHLFMKAPVLRVAVGGLAFAGVFAAARYLRHGAAYGAEAEESLRDALQQRSDTTLKDLKQALQLDRNPQGVRDIDRLHRLSDRLERGLAGDGFTVPDELQPTLVTLRDACINLLRKVVRLGGVAQDLSTPDARAQVNTLTAELLADANQAIDQLGHTLDQLQLRAVRDDTAEAELGAIRGELDAQLDVARRVEERLESLERSLAPGVREP